MYSDGPVNGSSSLNIPNLGNTNKSIVAISPSGTVENVSLSEKVRYEYYEHAAVPQSVDTTSSQLFINGATDVVNGGLSTWNTASSAFQPEGIGRVYTLRYAGLIDPVGGNPVLHVDFDLSGSDFTREWSRHHQSEENLIRNTGLHQHVHAVFTVFVDEDLFVSGGVIHAETSTGIVSIASSSIMVKEG